MNKFLIILVVIGSRRVSERILSSGIFIIWGWQMGWLVTTRMECRVKCKSVTMKSFLWSWKCKSRFCLICVQFLTISENFLAFSNFGMVKSKKIKYFNLWESWKQFTETLSTNKLSVTLLLLAKNHPKEFHQILSRIEETTETSSFPRLTLIDQNFTIKKNWTKNFPSI